MRYPPLKEMFHPISRLICGVFFLFRTQAPYDYVSLDRVLDLFLNSEKSSLIFQHGINAISCSCRTVSLVLMECPYSGSYSYIALACHILSREELMVLWWNSPDFEFLFEGFLSMKGLNKQDLQLLMPSVWWPGCIEEMHRNLCGLVIQFIPSIKPPQLPGSVFRTFLQNLLLKNRSADHNPSPHVVSSNSVLFSVYTVILHILSEAETKSGVHVGFLHKGGHQSFPISMFLKSDPHRMDISRLGGSFDHLLSPPCCMDDKETIITHSTRQKPCCCSSSDADSKDLIRSAAKGSRGHCSTISEKELLDALLLLYHLGLAPNFKQASYYTSHQSQSISLLEETDNKQIRERACGEQLKRLKEARNVYCEELIDCVRHCAWYRISLFSHWKQRGMYAVCVCG
ncbi:hypothetical protein MKW92_036280 [Papaver armeniacum]|nr:hypothetical protein MKW92_036280 [Papaver armeniacum]